MAIKIPVIFTTIMKKNHDEIELYLGNSDRSIWWHSTLEQRTPKNQSDWLYGYWVLLTNVQCHRYIYPYHDIENTGTYTWKHTWNHTVSNHPIHQHGHNDILHVWRRKSGSYNGLLPEGTKPSPEPMLCCLQRCLVALRNKGLKYATEPLSLACIVFCICSTPVINWLCCTFVKPTRTGALFKYHTF